MFDASMRRLIDPPLDRLAAAIAPTGLAANTVTVGGFLCALAAIAAISQQHYLIGLLLICANRFADGLDGALARLRGATDLGGYLDIVLDFIAYAGFAFAFALSEPTRNAVPGAFLLFSFMGTGCSFLAFAIMAAKRNISTRIRGRKSFYYLGGMTEGTETIALFVAACLLPQAFPLLAWVFGTMCWVTTAARIHTAYSAIGGQQL